MIVTAVMLFNIIYLSPGEDVTGYRFPLRTREMTITILSLPFEDFCEVLERISCIINPDTDTVSELSISVFWFEMHCV